MFGPRFMSNFFNNDPFFVDPFYVSDPFARQTRRPQTQTPSNVIIEEINDDENENEEDEVYEEYRSNQRRRASEPIIEEPSEHGHYNHRAHHQMHQQNQHQRQHQQQHYHHTQHQRQHIPMMDPFAAFNAMTMFSPMAFPRFSMFGDDMSTLMPGNNNYCTFSSSVTSVGPNGQVYTSTSSSKRGPGGVLETHHTERDSRTGVDKMTIHRQLGERARTLTRTRDREGREDRQEELRGIEQVHASNFDQEWLRAAGTSGVNPNRNQPSLFIEHNPPQHQAQQHITSPPLSSTRTRAGNNININYNNNFTTNYNNTNYSNNNNYNNDSQPSSSYPSTSTHFYPQQQQQQQQQATSSLHHATIHASAHTNAHNHAHAAHQTTHARTQNTHSPRLYNAAPRNAQQQYDYDFPPSSSTHGKKRDRNM